MAQPVAVQIPQEVQPSFRIVLVEDDAELCRGWVDVLEMLGHQVKFHHKAASALADTDALMAYDLMMTDYYLPDFNGVELISKVHSLNPKLPVILLTGSREHSVVDSARKLNLCQILHKPIDIDSLEACINVMMKKRHSET